MKGEKIRKQPEQKRRKRKRIGINWRGLKRKEGKNVNERRERRKLRGIVSREEKESGVEWRGQNKDQDVTDVEEKKEITKCK